MTRKFHLGKLILVGYFVKDLGFCAKELFGAIAFNSSTHKAVAAATPTGIAKKLSTGVMVIKTKAMPKPMHKKRFSFKSASCCLKDKFLLPMG